MVHTVSESFSHALEIHLGKDWSLKLAGDVFAPMAQGATVLLIFWLILLWMYRRKIFLRI